jgi:hypothetical protein
VERSVSATTVSTATGSAGSGTSAALARPLIVTGRRRGLPQAPDAACTRVGPAAGAERGARHRRPGRAGSDRHHKWRARVPPPIARTGWWQDGMAPGARAGVILIAGHVDSARTGPGAFFRLREANAGDRVQVTTRNGRTFTYRVVSVARYRKSSLPTSVYSSGGRPRLVLVTCGGPFETAPGATGTTSLSPPCPRSAHIRRARPPPRLPALSELTGRRSADSRLRQPGAPQLRLRLRRRRSRCLVRMRSGSS